MPLLGNGGARSYGATTQQKLTPNVNFSPAQNYWDGDQFVIPGVTPGYGVGGGRFNPNPRGRDRPDQSWRFTPGEGPFANGRGNLPAPLLNGLLQMANRNGWGGDNGLNSKEDNDQSSAWSFPFRTHWNQPAFHGLPQNIPPQNCQLPA